MTQTYAADYGVFPIDFNTIYESVKNTPRNGVISSLSVSQNSPTGMSVIVASGVARVNGTIRTFSSNTVVNFSSSHPTFPRKDLIVINSSGSLVVREGLPITIAPVGKLRRETHDPDVSDLTAGDLPIAEVWVAGGATQILNADISDRRIDTTYSEHGTYARYAHEFPGSDDNAKIQACVDSFSTNDRKTIYLLEGKGSGTGGIWEIVGKTAPLNPDRSVRVPSYTTIMGLGHVKIKCIQTLGPEWIFENTDFTGGNTDIRLLNMDIDFNNSTWGPTTIPKYFCQFHRVKNSEIAFMKFKNSRSSGFVIQWGTNYPTAETENINNSIHDIQAENCALFRGGGGSDWMISNLITFVPSTESYPDLDFDGISAENLDQFTFNNIIVDNRPGRGDFGLAFWSCEDGLINNCYVSGFIGEGYMTLDGCKRLIFENCIYVHLSAGTSTAGFGIGRGGPGGGEGSSADEDITVNNCTVIQKVSQVSLYAFWYMGPSATGGGSSRTVFSNSKFIGNGSGTLFLVEQLNVRTFDPVAVNVGYYNVSNVSIPTGLRIFNVFNLVNPEFTSDYITAKGIKLTTVPTTTAGVIGWNSFQSSPSWSDGATERIIVHKDVRQEIQNLGIAVGTRGRLNFTGAATVTDDAANNRINVDIVGGGGGGGAPVGAAYFTMGTDATLLNEQSIRGTDPSTLIDDDILFRWNSSSARALTINNIGTGLGGLTLTKGDLTIADSTRYVLTYKLATDSIEAWTDLIRIKFGTQRLGLGIVSAEGAGNEGDFWYSSSMRRLRMRDETTTTKEVALLSDLNFATFIPVEATLPASGAPTLSQIDGTNTSYKILSFADGVTQTAYWQFAMPRNWRETRMEVIIRWRAPTANTGSVYWEYGVLGVNNNENMDGVYSIEFVFQPPSTTVGNTKFTSVTLTPINFDLASNDILQFFLRRVGGHANDTMTDVAQLIEITIQLQGNLS